MIEDLKKTLKEVKEFKKTMHEGTTSLLVDKWIEKTEQMIQELKVLDG